MVGFVTVTGVEVSPDLKHARIFFSVLGDSPHAPDETLKGLIRARRFIQRCLADQAELRYTPSLEFRYDPTVERAQRMEVLLRQVAAERQPSGEESTGEAEAAASDDAAPADDAADPEEPR